MKTKRKKILRSIKVNESPTKNKMWGTAKKMLEEKYTVINIFPRGAEKMKLAVKCKTQ